MDLVSLTAMMLGGSAVSCSMSSTAAAARTTIYKTSSTMRLGAAFGSTRYDERSLHKDDADERTVANSTSELACFGAG